MKTDDSLEEQVITVLKGISGRREVGLDQMVGRDVGIYGLDGVEVLLELEELFGVDLDPLMRAETHHLPRRWIDRLLGREQGPPIVDLTVRRLIDFIRTNHDER
jgi:hypothetical protein